MVPHSIKLRIKSSLSNATYMLNPLPTAHLQNEMILKNRRVY